MVTPRLVDWIHGDGLQVIAFYAMNTRPNYYVARIDSKLSLDNSGDHPFCDEVLDDLYIEIEDQFGRAHYEYEADNGRTYRVHDPFPALSDDSGSCWDHMCDLKQPDKRSESDVRTAIKISRRLLKGKAKR